MLVWMLLAATAPVTLSCTFDAGEPQAAMLLHLDAAHGAVRYMLPSARPVAARALFTRDRVLFDGFTLGRRTLAIEREGESVTAALNAQPRVARGRCRAAVVTPAKAGVTTGKRGR